MPRHRIALAVGTRPEAIKMAPVIRALRHCNEFEVVVVATAQHRHMLDQVLSLFQITPDVDLDLMLPNQSLTDLSCRVLKTMEAALEQMQPDLLVVQGDTTTAFIASLTAFYAKIPVAHVEAGLRSHDIYSPFPEEVNRRLTSAVAEIHLAPTPLARQALLKESVPAERIVVTGNPVVDALRAALEMPFSFGQTALANVPLASGPILLVTCHRRESWNGNLSNICLGLKDLVSRFPDIQIVYPVHPNPNVCTTVTSLLGSTERIHLTPPLDYLTFVNLMGCSRLILTDSGGIQEEAPSLDKPVLIARDVTERLEAVASGTARLVGTGREEIVCEVSRLLTDDAAYRAMAGAKNPFGDGRAAERILEVLRRWSRGKSPLLEPEQEFGFDIASPVDERSSSLLEQRYKSPSLTIN